MLMSVANVNEELSKTGSSVQILVIWLNNDQPNSMKDY